MKEKVGKFTRQLEILPAFDRRSTNPKKNYGIHGVEMRWYLIGKKGVVQFVLFTNWQLDHVEAETFGDWKSPKQENHHRALCKPMAADIGYHSPVPMFDGHNVVWPTRIIKDPKKKGLLGYKFPKIGKKPPICQFFGKPCYYDGSSSYAEVPFEALKSGGEEALWKFMEGYYADTFNTKGKTNANK